MIRTENRISKLFIGDELANQKEEILKKYQIPQYINLDILEVGVTVTYLAILPLVKKDILKRI